MKQAIFNKEHPNGIVVDIEDEVINLSNEPIPYEQRVVGRIRERYSIDDELALLRQRDTKPEEFAAYNSFVEKIKSEEKWKTV